MPLLASSESGRKTELCSISVETTWSPVCTAPVNRHIERVSRVLRKSDAACVRLAQHLGDMLPAYFDNPPRRQRKPVPRASRICPACFQRVRHCLHRAARLWKARRRVIQINQAHSPFLAPPPARAHTVEYMRGGALHE